MQLLISEYILSCIFSKILRIIGQILSFVRGYLFNTLVEREPLTQEHEIWRQKTRNVL